MMKAKTVRRILIILLLITGLFDIISTIWDIRLLAWETNPLYIMGAPFWLMAFIKIAFSAFVAYMYNISTLESYQYFYSMIVVILAVAQIMAGFNNFHYVKKASTMQTTEILQLAPSKEEAIQTYSSNRLYDMLIPIVLSILSFKVWQWSYRGEQNG